MFFRSLGLFFTCIFIYLCSRTLLNHSIFNGLLESYSTECKFEFLDSQGPLAGPHACSTLRFSLSGFCMVIKHRSKRWRSKSCKVEHNTNSTDKIFCIKEIAAVYIQTFSKLLVFCPSNDNTVTDFCARIVDACLFQLVISLCCGKLNHADNCQCGWDFNTYSWKSHETFFIFFSLKQNCI